MGRGHKGLESQVCAFGFRSFGPPEEFIFCASRRVYLLCLTLLFLVGRAVDLCSLPAGAPSEERGEAVFCFSATPRTFVTTRHVRGAKSNSRASLVAPQGHCCGAGLVSGPGTSRAAGTSGAAHRATEAVKLRNSVSAFDLGCRLMALHSLCTSSYSHVLESLII